MARAAAELRNKMTSASACGLTQRVKSALGISRSIGGGVDDAGRTRVDVDPLLFELFSERSVSLATPAFEAA